MQYYSPQNGTSHGSSSRPSSSVKHQGSAPSVCGFRQKFWASSIRISGKSAGVNDTTTPLANTASHREHTAPLTVVRRWPRYSVPTVVLLQSTSNKERDSYRNMTVVLPTGPTELHRGKIDVSNVLFFLITVSTQVHWSWPSIELHDDVIKWKHFPRNWPFVKGIHRDLSDVWTNTTLLEQQKYTSSKQKNWRSFQIFQWNARIASFQHVIWNNTYKIKTSLNQKKNVHEKCPSFKLTIITTSHDAKVVDSYAGSAIGIRSLSYDLDLVDAIWKAYEQPVPTVLYMWGRIHSRAGFHLKNELIGDESNGNTKCVYLGPISMSEDVLS